MIEYTHRLEFDVLTAPLAEIDRRTLSQAWYSALDLAAAPSASPRSPKRAVADPAPARTPIASPAGTPSRVAVSNARIPATAHACGSAGSALERRSTRSELARRIERIVARPLPEARAASFALRGPHGRVQILVRSVAGRTHLIAICAQEARADVARALDQVRYALCAVRVRGDAR